MSASGEVTAPAADAEDRFQWHPAARVFDGAGRAFLPGPAGQALIDPRPAGAAVVAAVARGTFRIGGSGPAPLSGFETLTSGSSGQPRRIARRHGSWTASFAVNAGLFGLGPGRCVAVLGRLDQSLALYGAIEAVHLGASLHLLDDLRPDRQRAALAALGVDHLYATPAQMRLLVEAGGVTLPGLRTLLLGGSKLDDALRAAIVGIAPGVGVHEFYGAAEASFITLASPEAPPGSVGRAYPGVEIRVTAGGQVGQIWVKSPYLFAGYAGDDPGSALWQDGWLSVGEMGFLQDGYLYLAGRQGRMVTVADQNVFPEEIEAYLATLPGIRRVAVLPRPDLRRGHHMIAVVQGDRGREGALLRAARERLGPLKSPKSLIWRDDWPMLPSGKTDLQRIMADLGS